MSDFTTFAGLERLDPGDNLDRAFLRGNLTIIDRLLEVGAITHRHDAHPALAGPAAGTPPTLTTDDAGGTIPADTSINVEYTYLDADGGETLPSEAALITTVAGLSDPTDAPTGVPDYTAGTLDAHTYYYAISVTDGAGGETALGPSTSVTIDPGNAHAQIELSGLAAIVTASGGTGWRLWRAVDGGSWRALDTGVADTYTDNGSACADCSTDPPANGTTRATSVLHVTCPVGAPAGAVSFSIYASVDGTFTDPCLLGTYPIADLGTVKTFTSLTMLAGAPPAVSTALPGANKIDPDTEMLDFPWKRPVATMADLPSAGNSDGDVREALDTGVLYHWSAGLGEWLANRTGHVIENPAGTAMNTRTSLQFVGATVSDDPTSDRTVVTIASENWRGPWSAALAYVPGDAVSRNGSSWIAVANNTNVDPSTDDGTHWNLLAQKGDTGATGATGAAGAVGPQGPPGIGGNWTGPWNAATAYVANNEVSRNGSSYIAVAGSTNVDPATDDGTHWQMLAQKGDQGALGPVGPTGPTGPIGMTWRGPWSAATAYVVDDGVSRNGSSYIAVAGNTNVDPATDDGTHWQIVAAKGDAGPATLASRQDVSVTAAALAANASANVSMGLGKGYTLYKVVTNRPCRVRVYANAAYRSADSGRAIGTDPTGDHGCLFEYVSTAALLAQALAPPAVGYNLESPVSGVAAVAVQNLDAVAGDVTVTFTEIQTET